MFEELNLKITESLNFMMKQTYVAPETTVLDVEVSEMLAVSSVGYTDEKASNDHEALSNGRRSGWGDLWGGEQ